jgi:spermidine synthase
VALAAAIAGRARTLVSSTILFATGVIVLPLSIIVVRLCPALLVEVTGETIPFVTAAIISILIVAPIGLISGALFSLIARSGGVAGDSVVCAYLFEGIGAFAAGLLVPILTVLEVSTFGISPIVCVIVCVGVISSLQRKRSLAALGLTALAVLAFAVFLFSGRVDSSLDALKYEAYTVRASFDTRYSHQAILQRDSAYVLVTDNAVEATLPDDETAEYSVIPPLIYQPDAQRVLVVGRTEFGIDSVAAALGELSVTSIDPRRRLTEELSAKGIGLGGVLVVHHDPLGYFQQPSDLRDYDIVVLNTGQPDSYRNARFFTLSFFERVSDVIQPDGILYVQTEYDTDRYVSEETGRAVATIYHTLMSSFEHVTVWPGPTTMFFASDSAVFDLDTPVIEQRLAELAYEPRYVQAFYLADRLNPLRVERLIETIERDTLINTVVRPRLVHLQVAHQTKMVGSDAVVLSAVVHHPISSSFLLAALVLVLAISLLWKDRKRRIGLWLYFVAGAVSLSLELSSFYVYQSIAGSLFNELAILIGSFMLGLAVGAYVSHRRAVPGIDKLGLAMLLMSVLVFAFSWNQIPQQLTLVYHGLFLFVMAIGTGSLFVGATDRYYATERSSNRGLGYAMELAGSAMGALIVTPVLLPAIGLVGILVGLTALLVVTLVLCVIIGN